MKLTPARVVLGTLLSSWALLTLSWLLLAPNDRGSVAAVALILFLLILLGWGLFNQTKGVEVPAGSAAVITTLGGSRRVTAGPAKIKLNLLLETGQIHTLSQKPLDFSADFDTGDPVTIRITAQIAWEVHPDSLLAALDDNTKFTDNISRHVQSQLTYALGKRSLAEIRANLAPLLREVARSVNWSEAAKSRFQVREILVVQLRLPPELTSAATQSLIASLQTDMNRAQRSNRFSDRYAEARARAKELEVIDTAVRKVEERTIAFVENAVLLDQLSRSRSS